jgi:hypothetical protein
LKVQPLSDASYDNAPALLVKTHFTANLGQFDGIFKATLLTPPLKTPEGRPSRIIQPPPLLYPQQLIVFRRPFTSGNGADLDLPYTRPDRQIGDEWVFRVTRSRRHHRCIACLPT